MALIRLEEYKYFHHYEESIMTMNFDYNLGGNATLFSFTYLVIPSYRNET